MLTSTEFDAIAVNQATSYPAISLPMGINSLPPEVGVVDAQSVNADVAVMLSLIPTGCGLLLFCMPLIVRCRGLSKSLTCQAHQPADAKFIKKVYLGSDGGSEKLCGVCTVGETNRHPVISPYIRPSDS